MLNGNIFDILCIAETKIDSTFPNNLLSQPGYRQIRRDRQNGAGGLIAFIRDDLLVYRRRKLEPQAVESFCLDVRDSRKSRFIVCACYRSPKFCKVPDFISSLAPFFRRKHIKRIHTNVEDIDVANSLTLRKLATPTYLITMICPIKTQVINSFDGHKFMCLIYEINR